MEELVNIVSALIRDPETALLLISYAVAIIGVVKGWWVPKFVYDLAESRAQKSEKSLGEMTEALRDLTTEIRQRDR